MDLSRAARAQNAEQERRKNILKEIKFSTKGKERKSVILYEDEAKNRVDVSSIIFCDQPIVEGCLRTICTLVDRANNLICESTEKYFPPYLLYAETAFHVRHDDFFAMKTMSAFLSHISETYDFCTKVFALFRNIVQQIRVIREIDPTTLPISNTVQVLKVWRVLGDLLTIFVQLDEICVSRPIIKKHFQIAKKGVESSLQNPGQFSTNLEVLEKSLNSLRDFERFVLSGNSLRSAYEQTLGDLDENDAFAKEMFNSVLEMYHKWEKSAEEDQPSKKELLAISALAVYYHHHFANFANVKLVKTIFGSHKKVASFHLFGDIIFIPCDFLLRETADPTIFDKKELAKISRICDELRSAVHVDGMLEEAFGLSKEAEKWAEAVDTKIRARDAASSTQQTAKICLEMSELFLKGVRIADTITRLLKTLLKGYIKTASSRHEISPIKLSKTSAFKIFETAVAVKTISNIFDQNWRMFAETTALASQQWRCHAIQLIENARNLLRSQNIDKVEQEARSAALSVAKDALLSTANQSRMIIAVISLEFGGIDKIFKSVDRKQLAGLINRIENLCNPRNLVARVTNCAFLIHTPSLMSLYWETVLDRKPQVPEIESWCSAVTDCVDFWKKAKHLEKNLSVDEYFSMVRKGLLGPICCRIENDLRILSHPHLNVDERDRIDQAESIYLQILLRNMKIIKFSDRIIDFTEFVARYLEKTFYNLTVVAPHDAQTYSKMAFFAKLKYDIELINGDLPKSGIDESCNIMEITKTLATFVMKYNYSMSYQIFIEKQSPNRQLHVVSKDDLIIALRKYGYGLLPTTFNIAYQVLCKKLNTFYQFLSDDHIRAQLELDIRNFEKMDGQYPLEMAENFSKQIARIGGNVLSRESKDRGGSSIMSGMTNDTDDRQITYMDKFRMLITQIGNVLGFVRMMTVSSQVINLETGRNWTADVQRLVDHLLLDQELDETESLDKNQSLNHLKKYLQTMAGKKTENFGNLMVDAFRNALSSEKMGNSTIFSKKECGHLKNFYIIVPALTLSQVEHMSTCKNRLKKSITMENAKELTFTDDGFSIGIAYLLTILNIWPQFETLKWFYSVFSDLDVQQSAAENAAKTSQGAQLKRARIEEKRAEYRNVFYTVHSAKVFFLDSDVDLDEERENEF